MVHWRSSRQEVILCPRRVPHPGQWMRAGPNHRSLIPKDLNRTFVLHLCLSAVNPVRGGNERSNWPRPSYSARFSPIRNAMPEPRGRLRMRRKAGLGIMLAGILVALFGVAIMAVLGPDGRIKSGPHEVDTDGIAIVTAPRVISWTGARAVSYTHLT